MLCFSDPFSLRTEISWSFQSWMRLCVISFVLTIMKDSSEMRDAIRAVLEEGYTLDEAVAEFRVQRSTLHKRTKNPYPNQVGRPAVFTSTQER